MATVATATADPDDRFFKRSESIIGSSGASESEGDHETKKLNQKFFESPDLMGDRTFFAGEEMSEGRFSQPLSKAFPLAQQLHLLRPNAKKEQLFNSSQGRLGAEPGGGGEEGGGECGREEKKMRKSLPVSYDARDGR